MNNRKKGHDLERQVANDLKFVFPYIKTSRAASRLLDDCKIDLTFSPILVQCKAGYKRDRPKYEEEFANMKSQIALHFPQDNPIHGAPFVMVHKLDCEDCRGRKRKEEFTQVTMPYDFFLWLVRNCPSLSSLPVIH